MCGINGIFAYHGAANPPDGQELLATREAMHSRGPDGAGLWWSEDRMACFGHRRLAVLDLNERADQPIASEDGDLVVVLNGEIYNSPNLRATLEREGVCFRTSSDTEVLLHLYRRDGPEMVHGLRGMFAFAIWDRSRRGVFLARDPYGIKPLYTANDGWTFRFASQVRALVAGGRISRDLEPAAVVGFHLWGSVPEPFTLYREIRCLPAGHVQWVDRSGPREPRRYASVSEVLTKPGPVELSDEAVAAHVRRSLLGSVGAHLLSDVEVGVFLSGGIDSGAVLGLMREARQDQIRAITLSFEEFRGGHDDEVPFAAEVARLYGARHIVRTVSAAEFEADLPAILAAMDQPSIDGVNTWFVSKAAREAGLKVALSGLGGDELMAGYPSFDDLPRWVRRCRVPAAIPGAGRVLRAIVRGFGMDASQPKAAGLIEYGGTLPGAYLLRRGVFLPFELPSFLDRDLVRTGLRRLAPMDLLDGSAVPLPRSAVAHIAALESCHYLRNQLLRDADWAGMAHSVEIRTPLVDFTLLGELAPLVPCFAKGKGKRLLAAAPTIPLPSAVVARAKTGFSIPMNRWRLRGSDGITRSNGATSREWSREVFCRTEAVEALHREAAS